MSSRELVAVLVAIIFGFLTVFLVLFSDPGLTGITDSRLVVAAVFVLAVGSFVGLVVPNSWWLSLLASWFATLGAVVEGDIPWVVGYPAWALIGGLLGRTVLRRHPS